MSSESRDESRLVLVYESPMAGNKMHINSVLSNLNSNGLGTSETIYIKNKTIGHVGSKLISDEQIKIMIGACNLVLPIFAKAWDIYCPKIVFCSNNNQVISPNDWIFYMVNSDSDIPGAFAYHTKENNQVDGYVLVQTILDNGGTLFNKSDKPSINSSPDMVYPLTTQNILDSMNGQLSTVSAALFQELAQALTDNMTNIVWNTFKLSTEKTTFVGGDKTISTPYIAYAGESCDPVQDVNIWVHYEGYDVALSNFILPAWKNNEATQGPYDYRNVLSAPFTITPGGYATSYFLSQGTQIYGQSMPEWIKNWKSVSHRTYKRKTNKNIPHISIVIDNVDEVDKEEDIPITNMDANNDVTKIGNTTINTGTNMETSFNGNINNNVNVKIGDAHTNGNTDAKVTKKKDNPLSAKKRREEEKEKKKKQHELEKELKRKEREEIKEKKKENMKKKRKEEEK